MPSQTDVRLAKIDQLRAAGVEAYPAGFGRTAGCGELSARLAGLAPDTLTGEQVAVAGRVVLVRNHGALCFATLRDWTGDVQAVIGGPARLADFKSTVDLGDHVGVTGEAGTSRRGQPSVFATGWTLTAKCLHPLPDKHAGLADPEARVRQRYLDLIINPRARTMLRARSDVVHALRTDLHSRGYVEVETPMLQPVHGGANARPFVTHINAYDMRLYLRIAPELYLKRLCVGGVEKVFELGRAFRNEGVSVKHNPEFTMLEAYQAYGDYLSMMDIARELIRAAARAALGSTTIVHDGVSYDLGGAWPVRTVDEAISAALGTAVGPDTPVEELRRLADRAHDPVEQRIRLTAQSLRAAGGDTDAMELDEDFLRALEYAMPPSGGLGLGVDRVVMLLTGQSIRETLPFPLVRPSGGK